MAWRRPLLIEGASSQSPPSRLEGYFPARLLTLSAEFFPRGALSPHASSRKLSFARALELLHGATSTSRRPYVILTIPPSRWRLLLAHLQATEPKFVSDRYQHPEQECSAALQPANRSWQFERELRWRVLALGAAPGTGMHLHRDRMPLGSWHYQVFGRKRWMLCPPGPSHEYCYGNVNGFDPDETPCPRFRPTTCMQFVVDPGSALFYPEGWWHQTFTLDNVTLSISRSLITPSGAGAFSLAMGSYCSEALNVAPTKYKLLCEALQPCLRRLTRVAVKEGLWSRDQNSV